MPNTPHRSHLPLGASRILTFALLSIALTGCRHTSVSQFDEFEKVKVNRMVGNEVSGAVLSRTVVCLNAMREVRWPGAVTNQSVVWVTNYTVTSVTNLTVNNSALNQSAANTNASASLSVQLQPADGSPEVTTNVSGTVSPIDATQTGLTLTTLRSESLAFAPAQSVLSRTVQTVSLVSNQNSANTNNQVLTRASNQTITSETNWVITTLTNQIVTPTTNTVIIAPEAPVSDFYLYTEIAPQDFTLAPGENLILLVDGARSSFTPATPISGWQPRRGYLTSFYRVPGNLVVAIANAQQVKLRIRGASGTLERNLSSSSRKNFRTFLLQNFTEPPAPAPLAYSSPP